MRSNVHLSINSAQRVSLFAFDDCVEKKAAVLDYVVLIDDTICIFGGCPCSTIQDCLANGPRQEWYFYRCTLIVL
jgi:hypothetical protein